MGKYIDIVKLNIKKLHKNGLFPIVIGNFATNFLTFFGSIVLVRIMTKEDYGVLSYIENLYGFVYIFIGLGLKNGILRYTILADSFQEKYNIYCYCIKAGSAANCLIIILALIINVFYPHPQEYGNAMQMYIAVYVLLLLPQYFSEINITNYRSLFKNQYFAFFSILLSVGMILSRIVGYYVHGIMGMIWLYILMYCIIGCTTFFNQKKLFWRGIKAETISKAVKKEVTTYSIQYMFTNGIWALFMLMDVFLIGRLMGDLTAVADYRVAHVIPGAMTILSSTIGLFVSPYFVKKGEDHEWVRKKYKLLFAITAAMIAGVILLIVVIERPIISFIYGEQYLNIIPLMNVLLIAAFLNAGIRYTTANVLASVGLVKYNLIVSLIGIIVQVLADIILLPMYGLMGVGIANVISYGTMGILLFVYFNKIYRKK